MGNNGEMVGKDPLTIRTQARGGTKRVNISPKKKIQCTVENCQYSTPYAKDLQRHMRKHTGEKPFQCLTCSKAFSRRDKLKLHAMTHESVRPYVCEICSYATVDQGSLRKHQRTHTNERPYKCQLCPYQGKDSSQLVVHLRHHTGDTPYSCMHGACTAAFKTPSDLQRHVRLHTGEKPYKCPHCDYRAAVKCNVNTHVRKIHKDLTEETVADGVISAIANAIPDEFNVFPESTKETEEGPCSSIPVPVFTDTFSEEQVADPPISLAEQTTSFSTSPVHSKTTKKKFSVSSETVLPFQYACKACTVKCDDYGAFMRHMQRAHKDILKVNKTARTMVKNVKRRSVFKPNLAKLFQCSSCTASFAREDSLRCHLRQHAKVNNLPIPSSLPSAMAKNQMDPSSCLANSETFPGTNTLLPVDSSTELPLIMHSRTVIDGQTQSVYVVVTKHETSSTGT